MGNNAGYFPIFEFTRGNAVESVHYGAVAVVDVFGKLLAYYGDPETRTYIRSAAKPFQLIPFLESGGKKFYKLTACEIALMCSSHSGTDEHVDALTALQKKVGVDEAELLCGTHYPLHKPTANSMRAKGQLPTSNQHNCSGKHTGMLAFMRMKQQMGEIIPEGLAYIDPDHPVQREIISTFTEIAGSSIDQIEIGIDGCSAPNFALPLRNVAFAYSRLMDPETGGVSTSQRVVVSRTIASAMISNPELVAGPDRFDTQIMRVCSNRILVKAGAEGFQGVGLLPGALGPGSPGIGIAIKIADGDYRKKVRPAVVLEVLRQMGALSEEDLAALDAYGPHFPVVNHRDILVGEGRPCFSLKS
ncbi:MAG: asparaginase [Chloroflexota bacterium]|nr:asparaginase [Chloroflexota bacterium]